MGGAFFSLFLTPALKLSSSVGVLISDHHGLGSFFVGGVGNEESNSIK